MVNKKNTVALPIDVIREQCVDRIWKLVCSLQQRPGVPMGTLGDFARWVSENVLSKNINIGGLVVYETRKLFRERFGIELALGEADLKAIEGYFLLMAKRVGATISDLRNWVFSAEAITPGDLSAVLAALRAEYQILRQGTVRRVLVMPAVGFAPGVRIVCERLLGRIPSSEAETLLREHGIIRDGK